MPILIKAEYKCPHCGEINKDLNHLSGIKLNGKGIGKDPFIGKCTKCKKNTTRRSAMLMMQKKKLIRMILKPQYLLKRKRSNIIKT